DPGLLQSLARSSGYMASPATLTSPDATTDPVGSGPYVYDGSASTAGSSYVYTRNDDFWNAAAYPYDKVEVDFLDDTTAVLNGLGTPTVQVFGPDSEGYDPALEGTYDYDVDKARSLMADAGYADGFAMTLPDFSPVYPDEQAAMTEALAAINITVTYAPITGD